MVIRGTAACGTPTVVSFLLPEEDLTSPSPALKTLIGGFCHTLVMSFLSLFNIQKKENKKVKILMQAACWQSSETLRLVK